MTSRAGAGALWALLLLGLPARVVAHDVDVTSVARVFLDQTGERSYRLSVVDRKVPRITDPAGVLPVGCAPVEADETEVQVVSGFAFKCANPLSFEDVLELPWGLSGVVVLARWSDGSGASAYFRGNGRIVPVHMAQLRAGAGSAGILMGTYLVLGVEHILFGMDHLLFVLGLLLLVREPWTLVKTITAFTVAHSITLAAAVLGYMPVRTGPVEAAIALSIVLLAREVIMGRRGRTSLVHQRPWLVAFVFGLLHGLGFAGALGEIGLRSSDVPLALLFFNLGVEAGQLMFVAALIALYQVLRRVRRDLLPVAEPALGYALGGIAVFWLIERLPAIWGA